MKKLKKFLAMMISMVMVLSMATVGFATSVGTGGNLTVTLANDNKLVENNKHTVKLYKLLNLESYDTDKNKYSYSLNDKYTQTIKDVLGNSQMQDNEIIGKIAGLGQNNSSAVQKFANDFETSYKGNPENTAEIIAKKDEANNSVTINNLPIGYYLIVLDNAKAIQANLKNVVTGDNQPVKLKEEAPSIGKSADVEDVEIGQIVTYTITTTIPKQLGADMVYTITDTLSAGLDFVNFKEPNAIVTQGNLEIETNLENGDASGITASVTGRTMTIDLAEYIKGHQSDIGKNLTIKYKAKVNTDAVIETNNSATLVYGNNPGSTITNKPEKVNTPTFPVHINKVDDKQAALPGAKFELYPDKDGQKGDPAIKVSGSKGVYKIDPASGETVMDTVEKIDGEQFGKTSGYNLVINGLKAGTYWLQETQAPDGYNKIEKPIKITVTNNNDGNYTIGAESIDQKDDIKAENNIITIVNKSSSALPETGGTGTLLLTAVGALLVVIAMIRFMRRKEEN